MNIIWRSRKQLPEPMVWADEVIAHMGPLANGTLTDVHTTINQGAMPLGSVVTGDFADHDLNVVILRRSNDTLNTLHLLVLPFDDIPEGDYPLHVAMIRHVKPSGGY